MGWPTVDRLVDYISILCLTFNLNVCFHISPTSPFWSKFLLALPHLGATFRRQKKRFCQVPPIIASGCRDHGEFQVGIANWACWTSAGCEPKPPFGWLVRHFIVIQPSKYGDITEICMIIYIYTAPDRIMEKKNVSIYRRRLSMIEKLRTFFFP